MGKRALHSNRVVLPHMVVEATLWIENGKIQKITLGNGDKKKQGVQNYDDGVIMPGLIDPHVHINEPGRTDWEGFDSATKSAAAGGTTTVIDMPLNSTPVTTTSKNFQKKLKSAQGKTHINCGFWGGVVPDNSTSISDVLQDGVLGIKAFLTHSGIEDFPNVTKAELEQALPEIKKQNVPLLVHCELDFHHRGIEILNENPTNYLAYLNSRPKEWENNAIKLMIELCEKFDTHVHIVHLSSAEGIALIQQAKDKGLPITVETCAQYLFFNAEDIPNSKTEYKCAPPIREKRNNEQLWDALQSGLIDFVTTDHSPAPPSLKETESGNFAKAWGGIAGIQFLLPAVWSQAKNRGFTFVRLSEILSQNAAKFLKLENQKGFLKEGYDADIVIWNPESKFELETKNVHHKHKISPYIGQQFFGVTLETIVNGATVFKNGNFVELNKGIILKR